MDKKVVSIFKKRNSRAKVIIDEDDYNLLKLLSETNKKEPGEKVHAIGLELEHYKKIMNFSHKALNLHVNRLLKYGWIVMLRTDDKNYKMKILYITIRGKEILKEIEEAKKKETEYK